MRQVGAAIAAGNKIEAIKQYRLATGAGLKDSKEIVERLTLELRAQDPARFAATPAGKGCMSVIVISVVGALALFGVYASR